MLILERPWTRQPQGAVRASTILQQISFSNAADATGYDLALVIPSLGPVDLISGKVCTVVGTPPTVGGDYHGQAFKSTYAAANNTYRLPLAAPGTNRGTVIAIIKADESPRSDRYSGVGAERLHISWDHANASFRGAVARHSTAWVSTSLGTLVGGQTYCLAAHYDGTTTGLSGASAKTLYAIKDGVVVNSATAEFVITASTYGWSTNQISNQGFTFGGNVIALLACNNVMPFELVLRMTRSPRDFFSIALAPRRIYIPTAAAAASGLPTLSASTYVPGSITATGARGRVTATEP